MNLSGVLFSQERGYMRFGVLLLVAVSFLIGACATPPPKSDIEAYRDYKQVNDPLEPLNRGILKFNNAVQKFIFKPATKIYRTLIPKPARRGISNFLFNLETPVILINDLLQGSPRRAWDTTRRFFVNSIVGVGGLIDVAKKWGIPRHDEDFGQTLGTYGIREGPYLVLPIFGPSNPRDLVGRLGDILMDPFFWLFRAKDADALRITRTVVDALDTYDRHLEDIENLQKTSLDYYAALRSAYRQNRASQIRNGAPPEIDEFEDDIFDELDAGFMTGGVLNERNLARLEKRALDNNLELKILYGKYLED
ncbi:MAG: MlaA family lipoprotein [Alphaproteobacteria bacterium]